MLGKYTVDRRNPAPVEVGSLSPYFQGFINLGGAGFLNHQQYQSHGIHLCLQVGHTFLNPLLLGCRKDANLARGQFFSAPVFHEKGVF